MMNLLVVDDSELIRSRLLEWLTGIPGLNRIDTAASLAQTLQQVSREQPGMVILDLQLPDGNAIQIIPDLKRIAPGMQIAVLTNNASELNRNRCLDAGADWFFDKSTEFEKVQVLVQIQADRPGMQGVLA